MVTENKIRSKWKLHGKWGNKRKLPGRLESHGIWTEKKLQGKWEEKETRRKL